MEALPSQLLKDPSSWDPSSIQVVTKTYITTNYWFSQMPQNWASYGVLLKASTSQCGEQTCGWSDHKYSNSEAHVATSCTSRASQRWTPNFEDKTYFKLEPDIWNHIQIAKRALYAINSPALIRKMYDWTLNSGNHFIDLPTASSQRSRVRWVITETLVEVLGKTGVLS